MSPPRPTTPPRPPPTSSRPTNRPTSSSRPTTATTSISFPHFAGELSSKGHGVKGDVILLTDSRLLIHRCVPKHLFSNGVCTQFSCLDFGTTGQRQGSHSSQAPPQNGPHLLVSPSQWQRSTPSRSRCESMIINRSGCGKLSSMFCAHVQEGSTFFLDLPRGVASKDLAWLSVWCWTCARRGANLAEVLSNLFSIWPYHCLIAVITRWPLVLLHPRDQ